jgi:hypothetical protein
MDCATAALDEEIWIDNLSDRLQTAPSTVYVLKNYFSYVLKNGIKKRSRIY